MIQSSSPERIREITETVLGRPEFRRGESLFTAAQRLWYRLREELMSWAAENPGLANVLTVVLVIVLIALLAHIAYVIVREHRILREASIGPRTGSPALEALAEIAPSRDRAVALAREALEAGNLRRALWIGHRVLLSTLDHMELLVFKRWKTNTDYLDECGDAGTVGGLLSELTAAYERVIYAHGEFERERAARLLRRVESLAGEAVK